MTAATPLARYSAMGRGALRERLRYRRNLHHHQGHDLLLSAKTGAGGVRVYVLPITHSPPDRPNSAMEIPQRVKRHLGLDDERSWIVLDEVNDFIWPGFDLAIIPGSHPERTDYGVLPPTFFRKVRDAFVLLFNSRQINVVQRD